MINYITSNSPLLYVSTGGNSTPYINMNAPSSGMMRYNANSNYMEVYDGGSNIWHRISGTDAGISLDPSVEITVKWAKEKMAEEAAWKELAAKNNAVKIALDQYNEALQKLQVTTNLAKDTNETTS